MDNSKYEILVNNQIIQSEFIEIKGNFNFYFQVEITGNVGTHLSSLRINSFED